MRLERLSAVKSDFIGNSHLKLNSTYTIKKTQKTNNKTEFGINSNLIQKRHRIKTSRYFEHT